MSILTINIPDALMKDYAKYNGRPDQVQISVDNPQSLEDFLSKAAANVLNANYIRGVKQQAASKASADADKAANAAADTVTAPAPEQVLSQADQDPSAILSLQP